MPNGELEEQFKRQLEDWEKQAEFHAGEALKTQEQLDVLGGEYSQLQLSQQYIPTRPTGPGIVGLPPQLVGVTTYGIQAKARMGDIKTEITSLTDTLKRENFYYKLYYEVPYVISGGKANTVDDILSRLDIPPNITPAELADVEGIISGMMDTLTGRPTLPEMAAEAEIPELPELVVPTVVTVPPTTISKITIEAILKSLTAPRVPPPTMTNEEWTELLKMEGYSDADLEQVQFMEDEADRILAGWEEDRNRFAAYEEAIAEMPDYKLGDFLKEAVMQPGLALLEVARIYFEHVSMPLAGAMYKKYIPDIEAEYQRLKKTESTWMALSHAWENWDSNWFLKYMIMENLVDPLTYVGWGIATRILKHIPIVGRFLAPANRAIGQVFEIPFDLMKAGWRAFPKTIGQRALQAQHIAGQKVTQFMEKFTGKYFNQITMKDWDEATEAALKFLKSHPQSEELAAEAARQLLKHSPVDDALVKGWATRLGTTFGDVDFTRVTIESVENLFEDTFTRKLITPKEAAGRLLRILGAEDMSDDALKLAQRLIEQRAGGIVNTAKIFSRFKSPYQAMRSLMGRNYKLHVITEESAAALARKESIRFSALLADTGIKLQGIWRNTIDRYVVRPFAEAYLTFGMYGPMNVLEDYGRSILGGVFPRRMTVESWEKISWGLATDPELKRFGLSEMLGPLAREGTEEGWNNWIIQLAALGKKGWSEKVYTTLVRIPGGWGMDVRRNFISRRYIQLLREAGGETVEKLLKVGPKAPKLANRQLRKQLESEVYRMKLTGNPDLIRGVKDLFTRDKIMGQEVRNILMEHPNLPNLVRDEAMRLHGEGLLKTPEDFQRFARWGNDALVDNFIRGPEFATKQFQQLADLLTQMEVRNPQEMARCIQGVNKMSELYGTTPRQIMAQATIRNRGLPLIDRRASFDRTFDDIYAFMDRAGASIDDVWARLEVQMKAGITFSDDYTKATSRLHDLMTTKRQYVSEFRAQDMATRREIFAAATQKDLRTTTFWDDFYSQVDNQYLMFDTRVAELDGMIASAIEGVDLVAGIKPFARPAIKVVGRPLSPQDVANLIGARGDDISRALMDVLTAQNSKPQFTAYVLAKVRPGDEGFTKEAIDAVYDQIAHSLGVKPEAMSWITGKQMELDAVRRDLHGLYNSKLLPDEEIASIGKFIDDTADAVDDLIYTKPRGIGELIPEKEWRKMPIPLNKEVTVFKATKVKPAVTKVELLGKGTYTSPTHQGAAKWGEDVVGVRVKVRKALLVDPETPDLIVRADIDRELRRVGHTNPEPLSLDEVHGWLRDHGYDAIVGKVEHRGFDDVLIINKDAIIEYGIKVPPPTRVLKPEFEGYDSIRQSSMDEAHKWYYKEYTDYTSANAFDSIMKTIYPYWSISEDTEVLSRKGWKHHWELTEDDELLSFDKDTELTYWDKVQYVNVYDYDGEAVHMYDKGRDFICTPNHWWLVKREHHDDWEFVEADQLYSRMRFPKAAPHYFEYESLLTPDEAAILGWVVTDGTHNESTYRMYIQQSKQVYVDEIRELLVRNGCLVSDNVYDGCHQFRISPEYRKFLSGMLDEHGLLYIVSHLSEEASNSMWDAMYKAEGRADGNGFVQKEGEVLDAFELLSFITGRFVTRLWHSKPDKWYLYSHRSKHFCNQDLALDRIHYTGKMWCPRVEHRTILIRRNNKVIWSGNTYESQRFYWLPRSFVRHPGTFAAFERWQDNSDYGYIHIPGTSVDINPFRGTIYGTLTTRLTRRDFPEYYDALPVAGGYVEFMDFLSRYGFYPGAHLAIPLAMFGGLEQQMGETIPALWKTPLNALIATLPESESVKFISDRIFSDRFRDYMTILMVNKRGLNGTFIWTKIKEGLDLTEEEQATWDDSRREAALYGMGFEQFGLFRLRSDEQYQIYEESSKVIEEMTGYTLDQQDWLRRHGYRIWDLVGGMSPTQQGILQEMDYYRWVGMIRPMLPSQQQVILNRLELDWDDVRRYTEDSQKEKMELQQMFLNGTIGPDAYNAKLIDLYDDQRNYIDKRMEENPLMTLEGRADYYKKYGIVQPVLHPMRELLNLYFSVELQDKIDEETGELFRDWDTFWAMREALEDAVPENLKGEWVDYLARNSTRIEELRREVYYKYFRPYNRIWEQVLTGYPEGEQRLIKEYLSLERRGMDLTRQAEIKAMTSEKTGNLLVSSFRTDVSNSRTALRYANPNLDAWLFYWGRVTTFQTPEAETIYEQIARDTGRRL